jgi:glyoxylase-like metal-dependent hydrolase (beta-lactamase superfamily II)/rhodanese-related sulfurtransferase
MATTGEAPHPFLRSFRPDAIRLLGPTELPVARSSSHPPFLLDVRPAAERALSRIPDDAAIPLVELANRRGELPRDRPIVTYDHFGADARRAAELLGRSGFPDVAALEGGIDEYARAVDPEIARYEAIADRTAPLLLQFPRPETGCLAYLLVDPSEGKAIVIDPGSDPEPYVARLHGSGWELSAIVETHTHADHLAGHAPLARRTGAPIYLSARSPAQFPHRPLEEGQEIRFGAAGSLRVLETPGHTRDHLSLVVGDRVFTGDTLLRGSCGRTDLGDGDPRLLWESLQEKLLRLPDSTEVFPAHYGPHHALPQGTASTIGFERATNEALAQPNLAAFLAYMTEGWPPKPADFDRIVRSNLAA